jgi:photosystem II stability/assembly factor-like uncharacterized protein
MYYINFRYKFIALLSICTLLLLMGCTDNSNIDREKFYHSEIDQLPASYTGKWIRNGYYQYYKELSNPNINAIVVDPFNPASVYAASAEACIFRLCYDCSDSLIVSSYLYMPDRYKVAARYFVKPGTQYIEHLAMDPANSQILYAAFAGIFKTKNGGEKWKQVYNFPRVTWIEIDNNQPKVLYAGTNEEGLLKSTNRGNSWKQIFDIDKIRCVRISSIGHIIVVSENGLYKSIDAGTSWQKLSNISFVSLVTHPTDSTLVYATRINNNSKTEEILISHDEGQSWETLHSCKIVSSTPDQKVPLIIDSHYPNVIYWGTISCGVLKSCDGGLRWEKIVSGLPNTAIISLTLDPNNSKIIFCGTAEGEVYRYVHCSSNPCAPITCPDVPFDSIDSYANEQIRTKPEQRSGELKFLEWIKWSEYSEIRDSNRFKIRTFNLDKMKYTTIDVRMLDPIQLKALQNLIIYTYKQNLKMNNPSYSLVRIYHFPDDDKELYPSIMSVSIFTKHSPMSLEDIDKSLSSTNAVVEFTSKHKKFLLGLGDYIIYPQASDSLIVTLMPKSVRLVTNDEVR